MKTCSNCKKELPLSSFSKCKLRLDGLSYNCKTCAKHWHDVWYHKTKEARRPKQREKTWKTYGLDFTYEQYIDLCKSQDNKCAICGSEEFLCLDHCHDTKEIRGCLCGACNSGLGYFKDNPEYLSNAMAYLTSRLQRRLHNGSVEGVE